MAKEKLNTKAQLAYSKIRHLILSGTKLPGARLVLQELEEELGIGKAPIRDALMLLNRSGLVQYIPNKGALVASPPGMEEVRYIYELRAYIEIRLANEAMKHITDADIADLEALYQESRHLVCTGDNFFSHDKRFHRRIYNISRLPHLCIIVQKILESVEVYLNFHKYDQSDCTHFLNEHRIIIDALKNKDKALLEKTLHSNILGGLALIDKTYAAILSQGK